MKTIKRIVILIIAAVFGASVYGKYKAVDTVVEQTSKEQAGYQRSVNPNFKGGIGPVGNPYAPKSKPKKIY